MKAIPTMNLPFRGTSVQDPDPDPPDQHVFGPPGSGFGSISQRYGSGSGSFYHRAKIVRKTLIPTILWLFLTFYLWKMYLQKVISRKNKNKNLFFVGILRVYDENSRIRIRIHLSEAWIRGSGSGSTPKCHGSGTLRGMMNNFSALPKVTENFLLLLKKRK